VIPEDQLSSSFHPMELVGAKRKRFNEVIDYENGGITLNDSSKGLLYQEWKMWIDNNKIYLKPENLNDALLIYSGNNVTYISFTFDQNMNLVYIYKDSNVWVFNWFDSQINDYNSKIYSNEHSSFELILDDKRHGAESSNDILMFYLKNNQLCYRQQRERYLIERFLTSDTPGRIAYAAMNSGLRLQIEIDNTVGGWPVKFSIHCVISSDDILINYIDYDIYINDIKLNFIYSNDNEVYWEIGIPNSNDWKYFHYNMKNIQIYSIVGCLNLKCNLKIYKQNDLFSDSDFEIISEENSTNALTTIIQNMGDFWITSNSNINID
jgi:hypothetical protein